MKLKQSFSVVGRLLFLTVGMSWEVGAFDKRFEQTQGNSRIITLDFLETGYSENSRFQNNWIDCSETR